MGFKDALAKQRPHGTATYTFDTLLINGERSPKLEVRHAGSSNPAYVSNEIKMAAEQPVRRSKDSERARIERAQFAARKIAHGDVVASWQHVHDDPPTPDPETGDLIYAPLAPCTADKVEELLFAIIDTNYEDFMYFHMFVANPANFRDGDAGAGVALGKG